MILALTLLAGCHEQGACEPDIGTAVVCSYQDKPRVTDPWPEPTILELCDVASENAYYKLLSACLATGWTCRVSCEQPDVQQDCVLPEEPSII